ncbi:MAG TPA: SOS response-associated peptidase [Candidatus Hungatella pullicola]|nr:SOS response-associated peptidase [Candidatus Hungatella pullicola]
MFEDGNHFVILTTEANDSMRPVHPRMPLILEQNELEGWLWDERYGDSLLKKTPVLLKRQQEYEQQTLPFL